MHIAINLGVQKLASFQVDNLLSQEVDHEINMAMRRFINQRYSPASNQKQRGFEQSQKRTDDLRTLVEDYHLSRDVLDAKTTASSGSYFGVVYTSPVKGVIYLERFKFPVDYMFLINLKCTLSKACDPLSFSTRDKEEAFLRIRSAINEPGKVIRQIEIPNEEGILEAVYSTQGGRRSIEDLLNPSLYTNGFVPSLSNQDGLGDMFSESVDADSPHADGNEIYLKYPTTSYELVFDMDTVINVVSGSAEGTEDGAYAKITYDYPYTELSASDTATTRLIFEGPSISLSRNRVLSSSANKKAELARTLCKSVQHDDIFALLDDPFNTAKSSNIMYTVQENFVDLYSDDKTIPLGVTIKYLRRPADVNLGLGIGCELAEHTHHEIVEMTVKSILESFESPRYQTQSGEVLESE